MNQITFQNDLAMLVKKNEMTDLTLRGTYIPDSSIFALCHAPTEIDKIQCVINSNYKITKYLAGICFSNLDNIMEKKGKQ